MPFKSAARSSSTSEVDKLALGGTTAMLAAALLWKVIERLLGYDMAVILTYLRTETLRKNEYLSKRSSLSLAVRQHA